MNKTVYAKINRGDAFGGLSLWLAVVLIYWTHALLLGQAIVVLFVIFHLLKSKLALRNLPVLTYQLMAASAVSFVLGAVVNGLVSVNSAQVTLFHFYFIILFISLVRLDLQSSDRQLLKFCYVFLVLNYISLMLIHGFGLFEWMILDDSRGSVRYQFVFAEPSYLAIFSSVLIFLVLNVGCGGFAKLCMVFLLLVLVQMSNSASGFLLSTVCILFWAIKWPRRKSQIAYAFIALISLSIVVAAIFQNEFIKMRLEDIAFGRDASFFLRFIAPWMVADSVISSLPLSGTGFGFLSDYLLRNYADYQYLAKVNSYNEYIENTNIDSISAFIVSSYGLPVAAFVFFHLLRSAKLNGGVRNVFFVLIISFLMGSFVGPLFLGLVFLKSREP